MTDEEIIEKFEQQKAELDRLNEFLASVNDFKSWIELQHKLDAMTETEINNMIDDYYGVIIDKYSFEMFCKRFPDYASVIDEIERHSYDSEKDVLRIPSCFMYDSNGRFMRLHPSAISDCSYFRLAKNMQYLMWQCLENEAIDCWDGETAIYYAKKRLGYLK